MLRDLKTFGAWVPSLSLGLVAAPSPGHQLSASIFQGGPDPRLCLRGAPSTRACQPGESSWLFPQTPRPCPSSPTPTGVW